MSLGKKAGLAALAYLAYKAWNDSGNAQQQPAPAAPPEKTGVERSVRRAVRCAGSVPTQDRGRRISRPGRVARHGRCSGAASDPRHDRRGECDGQITPDERSRILQHLDKAGAGQEERRIVEQEIQSPRSLDDIIREVRDQDTAEQVYLASEIALKGGSATEQRYLDFLASRLNIPDQRRKELDSIT